MPVFRFKHFDIVNEASSMKVNTDGVLLGAAVTLRDNDRCVLDAGTGTGTIALMMAQRYSALGAAEGQEITGIDIDAPSAAEAAVNFSLSPWASALKARQCALRDYFPPEELDLIVSNPPFFEDSLLPPEKRRGMARHTAGAALSYVDLIEFAREHLNGSGRLAVILPSDREQGVLRYAASCGFRPFRVMRVRTTPQKAPSRIIMELSGEELGFKEECLTIQDVKSYPGNKNGYTPEYLELMRDFYLYA
ncbi:MAG: methyltransferase [Bacteroidia bacterium]|nr:methyltransferase [Bacteroidia bacterium]